MKYKMLGGKEEEQAPLQAGEDPFDRIQFYEEEKQMMKAAEKVENGFKNWVHRAAFPVHFN